MVVAGILAFLANLVVLRGGTAAPVAVAVAAHDLTQGTRLSATDLRFVEVQGAEPLLDSLLVEGEEEAVMGGILLRAVSAGEPLTPEMVGEVAAPGGLRAISIPVPADHAVGGTLAPGDRVDVVTVEDGVPRFVLVAAEVLAVPDQERTGLAPSSGFHLVVAVDADQTLELVRAMREATVDVVRSTGAPPPERLTLDVPPEDEILPTGAVRP